MSHLLRERAPLTDSDWNLIDAEARGRLNPALAARKLVDVSAPQGWDHSATNLGRVEALRNAPVDGVRARRRRVLPLVELRAEFALARSRRRSRPRPSSIRRPRSLARGRSVA